MVYCSILVCVCVLCYGQLETAHGKVGPGRAPDGVWRFLMQKTVLMMCQHQAPRAAYYGSSCAASTCCASIMHFGTQKLCFKACAVRRSCDCDSVYSGHLRFLLMVLEVVSWRLSDPFMTWAYTCNVL